MASLLIAVIYLAFISLGLPDSLLGSAWPSMRESFHAPESYAGYVSMTIALMTVVSALLSVRLIKKVKTHWIVICSIGLTVGGLLGFSFASRYWMLFVFAVPYGLGAGSVDASLNQYVADHYSARVMNFLHCFYGAGAIISPMLMGAALKYAHWNQGYQWTAYLQIAILIVCILSIPLWKQNAGGGAETAVGSKSIREALKLPAVMPTLIAFFAYCAGEVTCGVWTPSYFEKRYPALNDTTVAAFGSLIFGGLMIGRLIAGFVSKRINDRNLIRIGATMEAIGILMIALPIDNYILTAAAFLWMGIGMGPIYPAVQHMAPINFGREYGAPVIGLQMASTYIGSAAMPTVFGLLFERFGHFTMPIYLGCLLLLSVTLLEASYKINEKYKARSNPING